MRDDGRLGLVVYGVQDVMFDPFFLEHAREPFGFGHRGRSDQNGLPFFVALCDFLDDRVEFLVFGPINHIGIIGPDHLPVGGHDHHVQLVNFLELRGFRICGSGHSRKLLIHAEIILDRDGSQGLVFLADVDPFFRLDRLVKTIGPAPARHQAAGELVDDDHLAVFDHVIDVTLEDGVGLETLKDMMQGIDLPRIVEIMNAEQPLDFRHSGFRKRSRPALLIDGVVPLGFDGGALFLTRVSLDHRAPLQLRNNPIDHVILIGRFLRRAGDDERSPGFVD